MSGEDDGGGSAVSKPAETTLTTTAASSVAQTSEIQNTNAVTSGANVTAPQKTEKAGKPMTTMMMSSKNPPKQSEEDMKHVAQTARKQKEEWVRTNKDRESVHRSRTRSVEAYEKLEQVSVSDPIQFLRVFVVFFVSSPSSSLFSLTTSSLQSLFFFTTHNTGWRRHVRHGLHGERTFNARNRRVEKSPHGQRKGRFSHHRDSRD